MKLQLSSGALALYGLLIAAWSVPAQLTAQSDTPCNAPFLTVHNGACVFATGTTTGASYANDPTNGGTPPCAFPGSPDVWYAVVVPPDGAMAITTEEGTITDGGLALYNGPCSALTLIDCDDDDGAGMMPVVDRSGLTPGDTLYVRFWRGAAPGTGTFSICAVVSHSDCRVAMPICLSQHIHGTPYGPGSFLDENAQHCDISEFQSQWLRLHFISSGSFTFLIQPDTIQGGVYPDYDWLLFNGVDTTFCAAHTTATQPAACNGSSSFGPLGATGLGIAGTSNAVPAGPGNPYCPPITVNADDLYYLFINNYTTSSTGYEFVLGGTAQLDCGLPIGMGIGTTAGTEHLTLSPAPTNGDLWLDDAVGVDVVEVIDGAGRVVVRTINNGSARMHLDLHQLSTGLYTVRASGRDQAMRFGRVVVE